MQSLGGSLFVMNGISQDYSLEAAVASLKALCDQVVILDAGSNDGTQDLVKSFADDKTTIVCLSKEDWNSETGRQKLAHFTNEAISYLSTDWNFNLQADEIISEHSFEAIREAIEQPYAESYWCTRINLWGNSGHYLDVPDERKPVGTEIIRLAKAKYLSIDDAQSLNAQPANANYLDKIKIFHTGFVRSKYVHTKKIKHMLTEIFEMDNDKNVESMGEIFDCWQMGFSKDDVKPLKEPLPIFVKGWCESRDKINGFIV